MHVSHSLVSIFDALMSLRQKFQAIDGDDPCTPSMLVNSKRNVFVYFRMFRTP